MRTNTIMISQGYRENFLVLCIFVLLMMDNFQTKIYKTPATTQTRPLTNHLQTNQPTHPPTTHPPTTSIGTAHKEWISFVKSHTETGLGPGIKSNDSLFSQEESSLAQQVIHARERDIYLEFVHITKTGGSAIEKAAANAGIAWGACHFYHSIFQEMGCPSRPDFQGQVQLRKFRDKNAWHVPYKYYITKVFGDKKTFTIVRDPYERARSLYHDRWIGYKGPNANDPVVMNKFLRSKLNALSQIPALLPQVEYVFDKGVQTVNHILRYENLQEGFLLLMEQYNLSDKVQLGTQKVNEKKSYATLTTQDFDNQTVAMINKLYLKDFKLLNYTMNNLL